MGGKNRGVRLMLVTDVVNDAVKEMAKKILATQAAALKTLQSHKQCLRRSIDNTLLTREKNPAQSQDQERIRKESWSKT